jgi:TusA-related sulfurtransferase
MTDPCVERLDLRGLPCPQNAARALLTLAMMDPGERLDLLLDAGEPAANVPAALALEGHTVEAIEPCEGGCLLRVVRGDL